MGKRLILSAVIGGLVAFIAMTILWRVIPFNKSSIHHFTNPSAVVSAVTENASKDGLYIIQGNEGATKSGEQAYILVNVRNPFKFNLVQAMVIGALLKIIGAFIISYLLIRSNIQGYGSKVLFVTLAGLFVGVVGILPEWNWLNFTGAWAVSQVLDKVIGWFIGGLVIAKLVKN